MSQRKAQGVELPAQDPVNARVRAVVEATQKQHETLTTALAGCSVEEQVQCLGPIVLDLLRTLTGLQALVVPLAANMDVVNRELDQLKGDIAELRGRTMFQTPPLSRRA